MTRSRGRRETKEKLTGKPKITLTLKELKDLVKDLTVKITKEVTKSMEAKERTYTMEELKELKEVFSEASTRNPGTVTLTVPELEKLFKASTPTSVDITNNPGSTALDWATNECLADDCSSVVEYLKTLSIHEAAKEGKLDVVKYLFKKNTASVNITNGNGETPVHLAAKKGHLQVVKFLVEEAKADAYFKDKEFGATPLHWSAFKGHLDVVKYLVERNPKSIDIKNNRGETPLEVAKRCSSLDCSSLVEYLKTFKN